MGVDPEMTAARETAPVLAAAAAQDPMGPRLRGVMGWREARAAPVWRPRSPDLPRIMPAVAGERGKAATDPGAQAGTAAAGRATQRATDSQAHLIPAAVAAAAPD